MFKAKWLVAMSSLLVISFSFAAKAESIASFPHDFLDWPVVKESANLPADTVLPAETSLFIQESVRAYSWINDGQGSPLTIRVNPAKLEQYKTHGPYSDGITAVAVSEAQGIVWVTEHIGGEAVYGSYNRQGEDISHTHPSLQPSFCQGCHSTYKDICVNGTCTEPVLGVYSE